jgi:hypothetical protein
MPSQAKFYEYFAKDCVHAAKRMDDPKDRQMLLKMAREWMMEASRREDAPPAKTVGPPPRPPASPQERRGS